MRISQLVEQLRERGVKLEIEGDALCCRAPKGVLTPELKSCLASQKTALLNLLRSEQASISNELTLAVHRLFERQAELSPAATAVRYGARELSYTELNEQSNRLAHYLHQQGVLPGEPVAFYLDRSVEMIVSMLAILKLGCAYVPLDLNYPIDRLAFMLEDTQARQIITLRALATELPRQQASTLLLDDLAAELASQPDDNLSQAVTAGSIAYLLYTSGSTGVPKGVAVPHSAIIRLVRHADYLALDASDRVLQASNASFDAATFEIWGALLNGAVLIGVAKQLMLSPDELHDLLRDEQISILFVTTALFNQLSSSRGDIFSSVRCVLFGGEAADPRRVRDVLQKGRPQRLLHVYGPTENTTFSTWHQVEYIAEDAVTVPIGRAISGSDVYLLDKYLNPVPIGIPGELYTGGAGLADRYWRRPELTAERFVPNPFDRRGGARLYRTGDLCRYNADGHIEFLSRVDHQVKINGFRIELGEIDAALTRLPAVNSAVTVARQDGKAALRLVSYVVLAPNAEELLRADQASLSSAARVEQWRDVYETMIYSDLEGAAAEYHTRFNIAGWKSTYDGMPIPAEAMQEQVQQTVDRILERAPRRVLEIGCGTGLLLFRIAPHCERYVGTDFSNKSLQFIRGVLQQDPIAGVELYQQLADDFSNIAPRSFDCVVLNSVIQYFPSAEYLMQVLTQAIEALADGGTLFVGDIRNLALLKLLHVSLQSFRAETDCGRDKLQQLVHRHLAREEELLLDPSLFQSLKDFSDRVSDVEVQMKRGKCDHELTRFRYDVAIHIGPRLQETHPTRLIDWSSSVWSLDQVRQILSSGADDVLEILHVPNSRLSADVATLSWLESTHGPETVGEFRQRTLNREEGVHPEDFWNLADKFYRCTIRGEEPERPGAFRVRFIRRDISRTSLTALSLPTRCTLPSPDWSALANRPQRWDSSRQFVLQLRESLRLLLPEFMVPSEFVLLDELPLMPNGKVNRRALPLPSRDRSDLALQFVAPRDPIEERLAGLWEDVLDRRPIGIDDNFFELGGHSMLAVRLITDIERQFQQKVPLAALFQDQTIRRLAELLREKPGPQTASALVPLQPLGSRQPLYLIHPGGGAVFCYMPLARRLGADQPTFGLQAQGLDGELPPHDDLREMAATYVREIREHQPAGPYLLAGWSLGAAIAFEMAQQMVADGQEISLLALIDGTPGRGLRRPLEEMLGDQVVDDALVMSYALGKELGLTVEQLRQLDSATQVSLFLDRAKRAQIFPPYFETSQARHMLQVFKANFVAQHNYVPVAYPGSAVLFRAVESGNQTAEVDAHLSSLCLNGLKIIRVPGNHTSLAMEPHVAGLAELLRQCIDDALIGKKEDC